MEQIFKERIAKTMEINENRILATDLPRGIHARLI